MDISQILLEPQQWYIHNKFYNIYFYYMLRWQIVISTVSLSLEPILTSRFLNANHNQSAQQSQKKMVELVVIRAIARKNLLVPSISVSQVINGALKVTVIKFWSTIFIFFSFFNNLLLNRI